MNSKGKRVIFIFFNRKNKMQAKKKSNVIFSNTISLLYDLVTCH